MGKNIAQPVELPKPRREGRRVPYGGLFGILFFLIGITACQLAQLWPGHGYAVTFLTAFLFALMLSVLILGHSIPSVLNTAWFRVLAWTGSIAMGLWATFFIFSVPFDFLFLLGFVVRGVTHAQIFTAEQRASLLQSVGFSLLGVSGGIATLGLIEVLRGPRVKEVSIPIQNLAGSLVGLKLAQISDLHVGPTIRRAYVESVVARTNATHPDFIFITGDIADAKAHTIEEQLEPLSKLQARFGVFFVTGNHEYIWDAEGLINRAKALGFKTLLNENEVIDVNGAKMMIAGITDPMGARFLDGHAPDLKKAATSVVKPQLKVLLAHRPDACFAAEKLGFDVVFSGHTHAGQFFPFHFFVSIAHKYYRGLNRHEKTWVYINSGTGYWGPPNRFAIASEITLATLTTG